MNNTLSVSGIEGAALASLGADSSPAKLYIADLRDATEEQLLAMWQRLSPGLEELSLHLAGGRVDVSAIDFSQAPKLRRLSLSRARLSPAVLSLPQIEELSLSECFVGSPAAAAAEVVVGPALRELYLIDCNFYIDHFRVENTKLSDFRLEQDQDCAEHSIDRITFRAPSLWRVAHKSEWPTHIHFIGPLPYLKRKFIQIKAGDYSLPKVEVSDVPDDHALRKVPFPKRTRAR
jgi:hypothetical protein